MSPQNIRIEKVVYGAKGIGRIDGKVCFVEGALPGEMASVEISRTDKKFFEAQLLGIAEPSGERITPACPYYAHCGGCQYQHMTYREELGLKSAQVREMLVHHLGLNAGIIEDVVGLGEDGYRYRSSVTLRPVRTAKSSGRLGYVARDNASAVVVDDCLLADERLRPVFTADMKIPKEHKRVSFSVDKEGNVISSLEERVYRIELCGKGLWAVSDGFFQNNLPMAQRVAQRLADWVLEIKPFGFLDLYSGVGTFSVLAADSATELVLIEENHSCAEAVRLNMNEHRRKPWKLLSGKVEKMFPTMIKRYKHDEFVVFVDPPRTGLHDRVRGCLAAQGPFLAVVYLSCDLANLVRDLKVILAGGKYRIDAVVPFDMFPRTRHIETLVLLKPNSHP